MSRHLAPIAALVLLSGPARAFDITACHATVPANDTGTLQADLACGSTIVGIRLERNATLEMNGHTISGTWESAIECLTRRCTVVGPGEIVGVPTSPSVGLYGFGIRLRDGARLFASALDIHDFDTAIGGSGSLSRSRVKVTDVTLRHNNYGIQALRAVRADRVTASDNTAVGFAVGRLRGTDVTASGNGASGVFGDRVAVTRLIANDNGDAGVRVLRAVLRDSELLGNDGYDGGIDVLTTSAPQVTNTTCGRSGVIGGVQGQSWGVCAND